MEQRYQEYVQVNRFIPFLLDFEGPIAYSLTYMIKSLVCSFWDCMRRLSDSSTNK